MCCNAHRLPVLDVCVLYVGFHMCQFGKAGCSHVCLPLQEGIVCQCPPHMTLAEDGKSCIGRQCDLLAALLHVFNAHTTHCSPSDVTLPFILVSTRTELLLAPYQASPSASLPLDMLQTVPFTGQDIQFIQYDPWHEEVYVLDQGTQALTALHIGDWQQVCILPRL